MSTLRAIFERQPTHFVLLVFLLIGVFVLGDRPEIRQGGFLGWESEVWLVLAVVSAVAHQIYVWLCWRLELHGRRLTGLLGEKAFRIYTIGFFALIVSRPLSVTAPAVSNHGSIALPSPIRLGLSVLLAEPCVYLAKSLMRHFGFENAAGRDHFYPQQYRDKALVRKGIFRWTPNAMYVFGFLTLWIIALAAASAAALLAAAFSHASIWVHHYVTEQPEMRRIYRGARG